MGTNWYTGKIRDPLLDGKELVIGGQTFIVSPFRSREWIKLAEARKVLAEAPPDSAPWLMAVVETICVALLINYGEMTVDALLDATRPAELTPLLFKIMELNELIRPGEAKRPGEAPAAEGAATSSKSGDS